MAREEGFEQQHGGDLVDEVLSVKACSGRGEAARVAGGIQQRVRFLRGVALVEQMMLKLRMFCAERFREGFGFRRLRAGGAVGVQRESNHYRRHTVLADEARDGLQVGARSSAMNREQRLRGQAQLVRNGETDAAVADVERESAGRGHNSQCSSHYTRRMFKRVAFLAAVMGLGSVAMLAQAPEGDAGSQTETLKVNSNLVFIPTTVLTKKGETIYGLTADKFLVEADGVPQTVRVDESDDVRPLAIAVVVQCSRGYAFEYPKIAGLATMVDNLIGGAPAQVAVLDFGSKPELLTNFTTNVTRRERALNSITPCDDDPGAAIFDAVAEANKLFARMEPKGRHLILLISETRDHGSKSKPADTIRELGKTDTIVDAAAFSPGRDEMVEDLKHQDGASGGPIGLILMAIQALRKNAAKEFARESGGEYLNFGSQNKFDLGLESLGNRVNNYYLLSFVPHFPPNMPDTGPLHTLKVKVPVYPNATIRHRENYYADTPATKN